MQCCGAQQLQVQVMLVPSAVMLALMSCSSLLGLVGLAGCLAGWLQIRQ